MIDISNAEREGLLRNLSGKAKCPKCKKEFLYIGGTYDEPTLFCTCGFKTFVTFKVPA